MIPIIKRPEPVCLTNFRASHGKNGYSLLDHATKSKILESLLSEQGFLCAYCMTKISLNQATIEHWYPQAQSENTTDTNGIYSLDYNNMLAVCNGGEGLDGITLHCDKSKKEYLIKFNPSNPNHHNRLGIFYTKDGTINSTDNEFNSQLSPQEKKSYLGTLNLNIPSLKNDRKAVIKACNSLFSKRTNLTKDFLENKITKLKNNPCDRYVGVTIYFLEKKLRQLDH